jgi:hypothetical protein
MAMQRLSQRKFAVLVLLTVFAFLLPAFGSLSEAQPVSSSGVGQIAAGARLAVAEDTAPSNAGYNCVSLASLVTAKAGRPGTLAVRLAGFEVTYTGKEARLATGLFAYPGNITVTGANQTWTLPRPVDLKDVYFQLGGLCAVQVTPGTPPDVLSEGYSGGAHCCYGPTLYRSSAGGYRVLEDLTKPGAGKGLHWNANEGFQPKVVGRAVVLETSDGAFPYTFGCYACTPAPTRLFSVANGGLIDVTTRHPARIRAEAAAAWSSAQQSLRSASDADLVEGPLAEWAADKCELNEGAQMWSTLEQLRAQGRLAAAEQQSLENKQPFPAQLKAFLLGHGYCQGQF